jgi:competence protein ComEC
LFAALRRFWPAAVFGLALAGAFAAGAVSYRWSRFDGTRLVFLAVGQGDATVFQHGGRTLLIDCGPARDGYDAGERIVAPKLAALGVRTLDAVVITHPDSDHAGGFGALARRFRVGRVIAPACFRDHPAMRETLREARLRGPQVVWVTRRAALRWGAWEVRFDAPEAPRIENDNDGSLFVRIAGPQGSALITGDASVAAEEAMLSRPGPWTAQVLKAGHHGSATSTGAALLREVRPRDVAFSCGRENVYGHPAAAALDRVRFAGARAARTDREGDLVFVPSPGGFVRAVRGKTLAASSPDARP